MAINGYHILSLEANDIYEQERINGVQKGFVLPEKKDYKYFAMFKNVLDFSLDLIELEKCYYSKCRNSFSFKDSFQNEYTLAIISVKFNYTYKKEKPGKSLKELRKHFYENGFNLGGVHYVRYKRSSGSSRQGKCLFINEKLYSHMSRWGECGLKSNEDLASWESYKSLSLSSIKGTIDIPLEGILFINDSKSQFFEDVVSIEEVDGFFQATTKNTLIENDIWDGESLLDESLFVDEFSDKHMLLLRNKFFKSCAFRTKLKKWFLDKNITLDDLRKRGFITLATNLDQIVMVTTPNSMKFLKFMGNKLTLSNVRKWASKVESTFGVVKYDKRTKFFGGKMVQSSYQLINTLSLNKEQVDVLLQPSKDYLTIIRNDYDFMRYHFTDAYKKEKENEVDEISDGLAERSDVIFRLMQINYGFKDTELYCNFRDDVVKDQKKRLRQGHILLSGTNATLFGNGPEMLLALSGEFDIANNQNKPVVLEKGEIACARFENGEKLVCARSPHITMGNVYCATNNISNKIWQYFDLGENIVCVNAIGENSQQRLNGCDYDSDAMLVTNDSLIVERAFSQKDIFKVPVCSIKPKGINKPSLFQLDYITGENKIGHIVNLSQKLNSILWDRLNSGYDYEGVQDIYQDICKLAILSGIEIDKAKRHYDNVSVSDEIDRITKKHKPICPNFFKEIDLEYTKKEKQYTFYKAPMEFLYLEMQDIDYRKGKEKKKEYKPIFDMIKEPTPKSVSTVYDKKKKIISLCLEYQEKLDFLYKGIRIGDEDEKDVLYTRIKQIKEERNEKVKNELTEEYVLYLVLKEYESCSGENWHLYAPLLESELFNNMLVKSKEKMLKVFQKEDGEYDLYGIKFTKK